MGYPVIEDKINNNMEVFTHSNLPCYVLYPS